MFVAEGLSRLLWDLKPERAYEFASGNANNQSTLRRAGGQLKHMHAATRKAQPKPDVDGLCREAIETLPAAIYMTDAEGRITHLELPADWLNDDGEPLRT